MGATSAANSTDRAEWAAGAHGCADRDSQRFALFAGAHQPGLLKYALALTGSHDDAWDLLQDTFMTLARNWHTVREDRNAPAYARVIMVRTCLNRRRAAARRVAALLRLERQQSWSTQTDHPGEGALPAGGWEPWLEAAFRGLPTRQRASVGLVHLLGFSLAEAADLMDCRRETVKTHLARGISSLRAAATAHEGIEDGI